jgi:hypothetical protein
MEEAALLDGQHHPVEAERSAVIREGRSFGIVTVIVCSATDGSNSGRPSTMLMWLTSRR